MNALELDTVRLSGDRKYIEILDQTVLPGRISILKLDRMEDIREAIRTLQVRGAPAIGVCAAYALALGASRIEAGSTEAFLRELHGIREYLNSARPTAVNLSWALNRVEKKALEMAQNTVISESCTDTESLLDNIREALFKEAQAIRDEDAAISRAIGETGYGLLAQLIQQKQEIGDNQKKQQNSGCGILTHCNAGTLATVKYGTATAPMYIALEHGMKDFRVYCDETRPLLQGARLTAFEMQSAGIDTTLICDNMASYMMQQGKIDIIFVGCDRVARNGDAANKIGTSGVAILAKHYGIPFYVCAPSSTIDLSIATGAEIPIEHRAPEEVTEMWYRERMAPEGVKVCNPAFDVTDHSLITGIITEKGLCTAPYEEAFARAGIC
jgi:methylthioribose-1-phosphate isomerase